MLAEEEALSPPAASQGFGSIGAPGGPGAICSAVSASSPNGAYAAALDIPGGYVFWDNGPDGPFGEDTETTDGSCSSTPPTTSIVLHDPEGNVDGIVAAIAGFLANNLVVYDAFGNPVAGAGASPPAPPTQPQPQQDGSILNPTGLRTDSTGNGTHSPSTNTDVDDGDDGTGGLGSLRSRLSFGTKNLLASAPFQPGSDGRQFFANAVRMVPGLGAMYSGSAAATGKDPIAVTCEGIGPRVMDGLGFAGGLFEVFHSGADAGEGTLSSVRRRDPMNNIVSRIDASPKLVREAEAAGKSMQSELDGLTRKLAQGNMNPGIDTRFLFSGIYESRSRNGGRVYFRNVGGIIEILAKSMKDNQDAVIATLKKLYGQ